LIRRLGPTEWELLRDVRLASLLDAPAAFASSLARELDFDEAAWRDRTLGSAWFVATAAEQFAGVVAGRRDPKAPAGQRHLNAMWLAPAARGGGLAAELVDVVVQWAREDGGTELTLGVFAANQRAIGCYRKCGFEPTGELHVLDREPHREVEIYRLDLTR